MTTARIITQFAAPVLQEWYWTPFFMMILYGPPSILIAGIVTLLLFIVDKLLNKKVTLRRRYYVGTFITIFVIAMTSLILIFTTMQNEQTRKEYSAQYMNECDGRGAMGSTTEGVFEYVTTLSDIHGNQKPALNLKAVGSIAVCPDTKYFRSGKEITLGDIKKGELLEVSGYSTYSSKRVSTATTVRVK